LGVKVYPAARIVGASREKPAGRPGTLGTAVTGPRKESGPPEGRRDAAEAQWHKRSVREAHDPERFL